MFKTIKGNENYFVKKLTFKKYLSRCVSCVCFMPHCLCFTHTKRNLNIYLLFIKAVFSSFTIQHLFTNFDTGKSQRTTFQVS